MDNARFEALKEHFGKRDSLARKTNSFGKTTKKGLFLPSPLEDVRIILDRLVENGSLDTSKPFLDAGCGDGRIMALASLYGFSSVFGIEYDCELAHQAKSHLDMLRDESILNDCPFVVAIGDFTDYGTYRKNGITFESVGTFFNYINNQSGVASMVANGSPSGTKFLLYQGGLFARFDGLNLEKSLKVVDNSRIRNRISIHQDGGSETSVGPYKFYFSLNVKP